MEVVFLGYYGGDVAHAASAWTSTMTKVQTRERVEKLLAMLAENEHYTPFEKSLLHFRVTSDIATHIHLLKHRIGVSINAESARYKEIKEDRLYIPQDWPAEWQSKLAYHTLNGHKLYHESLSALAPIIGRKRAKETSRYFKTYSSVITCDVSFNWRSFYHFYKLRASNDAQVEISNIARQMLYCIQNIEGNPFELTLKAFKLDQQVQSCNI